MNMVDDSRTEPAYFAAILAEPSLPIFLQLLVKSSNHNLSLLALCDNQRLLYRSELARWFSVRGADGTHDKQQTGRFIRTTPAQARGNIDLIMKLLGRYIKGEIFLQPFVIEIAVETMGFTPLPWVHIVSSQEKRMEDNLLPLLRLLNAPRDGALGVRRALARTLTVFAEIRRSPRLPVQADDFAMRFETALSVTAAAETRDISVETEREHGLAQFAATYEKESFDRGRLLHGTIPGMR